MSRTKTVFENEVVAVALFDIKRTGHASDVVMSRYHTIKVLMESLGLVCRKFVGTGQRGRPAETFYLTEAGEKFAANYTAKGLKSVRQRLRRHAIAKTGSAPDVVADDMQMAA